MATLNACEQIKSRLQPEPEFSVKPVKPVAEKSNHPQDVGIEMM